MDHDARQPAAEPELVSTPAEAIERWPRPVHYVFWTLCVGIGLVDTILTVMTTEYFSSREYQVAALAYILSAVSTGTSLFGIGLFIVRCLRGVKFPQFEGDFLLIAMGIGAIGYLLFHSLLQIFFGPDGSLWSNKEFWYIPITTAVIGGLVLLSCWRRASLVWKIFILIDLTATCVTYSIRYGVQSQSMELFALYQILRFVPACALLLVAIVDYSRKNELSWTHWLGIGAFLWATGTNLAMQVWFLIMPYIRSYWPF